MTRQTAREKHRKEKKMTYAKSLKKRRSFLKTNYTSQVTFPLALSGPLQSCCSWPPTPTLLAQLPSLTSSENIKDAELGVPAATHAQRNNASPNPSSGLVEMEPDTMETKSVTDLLVSSISAVHLQGVAMHVDSGLQPTHAVHLPFLSLKEGVPLPVGTSCLQAVRSPAQGSSYIKTNTGLLSEESCMATKGWLAQVAQEEMGKVMAAQQVGDTHPCPGQEVTCPANKHTLPAHGSSVDSPHEVDKDQDQELLLTAGREAACEEPVPALCEEGKANCDSCAENSSDSALLQAKSRPVINREALRKVHNKNHIGFPNATQLLTDCSSTSGVITRLSWLSCGLRTDLTSSSPSQERADIPLELLAFEKTSGCLRADAVGKEIQTSPAGALFVKELLSSQELNEDPRKDAENVALTQPQPVHTPLPREQPTEVGKDSPITPSVGLSTSSGPVPFGLLKKKADHGASKHSLLCFNHKEDEQSPPDPIMTRSLGFFTMKKTSPPQLGMDKCSCRLSYISCFHRPDDKGECETTIPMCNMFLGPLTTPPSSSCSLPGTPVSSYPVSIARDMAWWDPYVQALSKLKDQAQMSPADFSCFLAYTTELQEVVGKLSRNQATHLQGQCSEQGAESKGTLGLVSRDLLSSCQELLKTQQPLKELQGVLRVTFNHLVQLAVACFQVTHCQLCSQRQQKLGAALTDVVGTYQQLVLAVHQQLCRQGCPDLGAKLLARQHTALTAAMFCLLQQLRVPPLL